jgi:hypothetical protein
MEARVSRIDYEALHWGDQPQAVEDLLVPQGYGKPVTEVEAISYVTSKEGKVAVFRHDFSQQDGRYPYLLEATPGRTAYALPKASSRLVALGRVIDLELADGRVIYTPFLWVVTTFADDSTGGPVLLASRFAPIYAIEHRNGKPHVKSHGIID